MLTLFILSLVALTTGIAANANDTPAHSQDSVADHHLASEQSSTVRILVQQFGAVGDGVHDDGPALRRVFAEASQCAEPTVIVFEKEKAYYVAPYAEANGRLMLYEATNVTVEGNGAMLLVHTPNRALGIYRSSNIVVRNLQIDYRPIPFVQGSITKIDNKNSFLEFKPDPGYEPPVEGDDSLYIDGRNEDSVTFNRETRKFYHAHSRVSGVTAIDAGKYRVSYRGHRFDEAIAGDFFAMKNRWGHRPSFRNQETDDRSRLSEYFSTGDPSISVVHSSRVLLQNIDSLAAPGMTVNARGCDALVIQGLQIRRHGDRLVAGCSDGIHLKCNQSQPIIKDCFIEATMDDSIHIKISGDVIRQVESPRRFRISHMDIAWDNTNLGKGKQVMVYRHADQRQLANATITAYDPIDYRNGWVTLDRDLPDLKTGDSLYLNAVGTALIEGCQFGTQLQRAILTHQPTIVRDCVIEDNGQGIVVSFSGIEGPPSQQLTVERCTFTRIKHRAISFVCPSKDYDPMGSPHFVCIDTVFNLGAHAQPFHIVNAQDERIHNNHHRLITE